MDTQRNNLVPTFFLSPLFNEGLEENSENKLGRLVLWQDPNYLIKKQCIRNPRGSEFVTL